MLFSINFIGNPCCPLPLTLGHRKMSDKIICAKCNFDLTDESLSEVREACPVCGSKNRIFEASIYEKAKIYDSLRGQAKDPKFTGKQKLRWDSFSGWEKSHARGKLVKKERLIDKDKNIYKEIVTDPDTNEIIHSCEESLDKHIGHGSAKQKKPQQQN